jgi:glycosyltransferase involved in cell wall biosynthesis
MKIMLLHAPEPLARELSRCGHEVLSCNTVTRGSSILQQSGNPSPPIAYAKFEGGKKISLTAIRKVSFHAQRFQPDVLHAFKPSSLAWAILATLGMRHPPKVISFRGITRSLRRFDPSEWISYLSPRVSMHACESRAVMDAMVQSGIPEEKCRVVYNTPWDFDQEKTPADWRSLWKFDHEEWVIGTVANVRRVKGIDILLRAVLRMTDLPNWRIVIMGHLHDPEVIQLMKRPELEGRLFIDGYRPDAPSAMKAFDVFVMPSRSEGLCLSLVEAMTQGVCPIVSSAGGMKELVRNEQDGLVFPIEDVEGLHSSLRSLYGNTQFRDRLGKSAKDRAQAMCTPEIVGAQLEMIYRSVTNSDCFAQDGMTARPKHALGPS